MSMPCAFVRRVRSVPSGLSIGITASVSFERSVFVAGVGARGADVVQDVEERRRGRRLVAVHLRPEKDRRRPVTDEEERNGAALGRDAFLGHAEDAGVALDEAGDLGPERRRLEREGIARVNAGGRPRVPERRRGRLRGAGRAGGEEGEKGGGGRGRTV